MCFYVYILKSAVTAKFYCGQTSDLNIRLDKHNAGLVKSTKHAVPWKLIHFISCISRAEAMALEKSIKARGIQRWLSDLNIT